MTNNLDPKKVIAQAGPWSADRNKVWLIQVKKGLGPGGSDDGMMWVYGEIAVRAKDMLAAAKKVEDAISGNTLETIDPRINWKFGRIRNDFDYVDWTFGVGSQWEEVGPREVDPSMVL